MNNKVLPHEGVCWENFSQKTDLRLLNIKRQNRFEVPNHRKERWCVWRIVTTQSGGGDLSSGQDDVKDWKHIIKPGLYSDDIKRYWNNLIKAATRSGFHE